jgi:KipI family sensor histidine kinase inhibitor
MTIEPLGDRAFIVRDLQAPAWRVAEVWRQARLGGVSEVVAAYETVVLYTEAGFDPGTLREGVAPSTPQPPVIEVPVRYDGPDLDEVADRLGWSRDQVIAAHTATVYTCYAIGFCPGFPYLGYLEGPLNTLGRRPEPRVRVAPGSVAIAGRQTGIYPLERPGGWWLLGTTDFRIVDLEAGFFAFQPGDRVKFVVGT